ncbi:MAG: peptidoglycan DD-metalloendopeptidase family protein [Muribaculaceae bacterium]|nr:peptidoglycan DD-metalloendopeptidase family protein [Muribaculaceae bacterium]
MKEVVKRCLRFIIIVVIAAVSMPAAGQRTAKNIKKEKQETTRKIKETSRKIDVNTKETSRQMNKLNSLNADIREQVRSIRKMQHSIDSVNRSIRKLNDSVAAFDRHLSYLRNKYAEAVRKIDSHKGSMDKLSFIFSSESFSQAYRRMRYLEQFSRWKSRKSEEIKSLKEGVERHRERLAVMKESRRRSLEEMKLARRELQEARDTTSVLVADLKKEGKLLKAYLRKKEKESRALDDELERIIVEEQRRAEEARKAEEKRQAEERKRRQEEEKRLAREEREQQDGKNDVKPEQPKKGKTEARPIEDQAEAKPEKQENSQTFDNVADAERKLTGSFEDNRGRLLFPVSGKYKIVKAFGRQRHPDLRYVQTDNSGIDIEVPAGSEARAVFAGKVSEIFRLPGFNNIVMVRHGSYLTIYANLETISVKKGDTVNANQKIGRIYSDPDDGNRTILHFEVRKEKVKLNPEHWVK